MKLPSFLRPLSLEERVAGELTEARFDRLRAFSHLEYYQALLSMSEARISRLEGEMSALMDESQTIHYLGGKP